MSAIGGSVGGAIEIYIPIDIIPVVGKVASGLGKSFT